MKPRKLQRASTKEPPPHPSRRKTMDVKLTAIFKKVPEGYIGFVQELPGANTQGRTLEEARANLQEAITLVLEANRELAEEELQGEEVIREAIPLSAA
jgi:predicted RNase H-like HicB family nuclease